MVGLLFAQAQLCAGPDLDHIRSSWGPTAHLKVGPSAVVKQTGYTSPMAQMVKHLRAVQKTQVQSLGQEDPLEKEMATHSSILAWKIPMDGGTQRATVHGVAKSRTRLSNFTSRQEAMQKAPGQAPEPDQTLWAQHCGPSAP